MKINWLAILGLIASGGLAGVVQALGTALPHEATVIANVAAIVVAIAAVILQAVQPAASIVSNAPVVNDAGEQVATNVSSTTQLFQKRSP